MSEEIIASPANPLIKRMRLLAHRKHRQQQGAAVVDGIQPVWQAVEAGVPIEVLVYSPELLGNEAAVEMLLTQERQGVRVARVTAAVFLRLSGRDHPAGLAAIIRPRLTPLAELEVTGGSTFVALDRVANPGNLGTIVRTADATGAGGVILVGPTTDPFDPAALKASMGAAFSVPIARVADSGELVAWARANAVRVVTTAARATESLWTAPFSTPQVIVMGSEGDGLDDAGLTLGDVQLSIPMVGTAESLNLAAATSIVLYEAWRRRSTS